MISLFSFGGITFSFVTLEIKVNRPPKGEKVTKPTAEELHPREVPDAGQIPQLLAATEAPSTSAELVQSALESNDRYFLEQPDGSGLEVEPEPWMIEELSRAYRDKMKIPLERQVYHVIQQKYFIQEKDDTLVEIDPEPWMLRKYRYKVPQVRLQR